MAVLLHLKKMMLLKAMGYRYVQSVTLDHMQSKRSMKNELAEDIETLREQIGSCHLCELSKYREHVVIGEGISGADVMFVGTYPGMAEDASGKAFAGRSGQMLEKMIRNVLHTLPEKCYFTYLIRCKPSSDSMSVDTYAERCGVYLLREIELIRPKVIVSLGVETFNFLMHEHKNIEEARGMTHRYNDDTPLVVTYSPVFLLRNPGKKAEALQDLMSVKRLLG
jgi:DNA polymerase